MSRIGKVLKTSANLAAVTTERRGVCESCDQKSSCSFEHALGKGEPEEVEVQNSVGAVPGDLVEFDLPGHGELKVALLIWAVPLIGLVAGAILGSRFHESAGLGADSASLLGAVAGLVLFFLPLVAYDRLVARNQSRLPIIMRVLENSCPEARAPRDDPER